MRVKDNPDLLIQAVKRLMKKFGYFQGQVDAAFTLEFEKAWATFCRTSTGAVYTPTPDPYRQPPAFRDLLLTAFAEEVRAANVQQVTTKPTTGKSEGKTKPEAVKSSPVVDEDAELAAMIAEEEAAKAAQ